MKLNYYIITGTSRGIGEALAIRLIKPGNFLICISRTQNPRLRVQSIINNGKVRDIDFDLGETHRLPDLIHGILRTIDPDEVASVTLVNNAGTIQPVNPVGQNNRADQIDQNYKVNLIAPALIMETFIRFTEDWKVERRILNVSSFAAKMAVPGWSAFSASKAGLEMLSQCLATEQLTSTNPVKVVSFSPSVVDAEWPKEIERKEPFPNPDLNQLRGMKEKGELHNPLEVAEEMEKLLESSDFGAEIFVRMKA